MNTRRRAFVNAYLGEAKGNATKAAVIAGYSEATARQAGSRLLTFPDVKAAIEEGQAAANERAGMSAQAIISELSAIAQRPVEKVSAQAKLKALELVGKAQGMFRDEEKDGRVVVNIGFLNHGDMPQVSAQAMPLVMPPRALVGQSDESE